MSYLPYPFGHPLPVGTYNEHYGSHNDIYHSSGLKRTRESRSSHTKSSYSREAPPPSPPLHPPLQEAPVIKDGKISSYCYIPPYLPPGGAITKGWPSQPDRPIAPDPDYSYTSHPNATDVYHLPPDADRIKPTRTGYWNRRGDTIAPSGHLVQAGRGSLPTYPKDLSEYPEHALMNEAGKLVLPATCQERVALWQRGVQDP